MPKSHPVSRAVAAIVGPMLAVGLALPAYSQTREGSRTDKSTPEKIYHNYCSVCHGDKGDGRSRAQNSFVRPPKDFTKTDPMSLPRDYMIAIVRDGKAGTAMVGWKTQLTDKEIEQVVDYVRAKFMGAGAAPSETPKAPAAAPAEAARAAAAPAKHPSGEALMPSCKAPTQTSHPGIYPVISLPEPLPASAFRRSSRTPSNPELHSKNRALRNFQIQSGCRGSSSRSLSVSWDMTITS